METKKGGSKSNTAEADLDSTQAVSSETAGDSETVSFLTDTTAITPRPEKVLRVYRSKVYGKEKMFYIIDGKEQAVGITIVPTYRKYKTMEEQQDGTQIPKWHEDKTMVIAKEKRYDIDYDKEAAKDLVKRCEVDALNPQFLFKIGNRTITIRDPENFFGDFDEVIKKARKGEPV